MGHHPAMRRHAAHGVAREGASGRTEHTTVWAGSEMTVIGSHGDLPDALAESSRYMVFEDRWGPLPAVLDGVCGLPPAMQWTSPSAIWTSPGTASGNARGS